MFIETLAWNSVLLTERELYPFELNTKLVESLPFAIETNINNQLIIYRFVNLFSKLAKLYYKYSIRPKGNDLGWVDNPRADMVK